MYALGTILIAAVLALAGAVPPQPPDTWESITDIVAVDCAGMTLTTTTTVSVWVPILVVDVWVFQTEPTTVTATTTTEPLTAAEYDALCAPEPYDQGDDPFREPDVWPGDAPAADPAAGQPSYAG